MTTVFLGLNVLTACPRGPQTPRWPCPSGTRQQPPSLAGDEAVADYIVGGAVVVLIRIRRSRRNHHGFISEHTAYLSTR